MAMAFVTAQRSTCLRRQVGCVLLNVRGHVLATGYNGVAAGQNHCNEPTHLEDHPTKNVRVLSYGNACPGAQAASGTQLDGCYAIHAEQNAMLQCRDVYDIETAYVTASPCVTCTKLLLNTGCQRIVFLEEYPHGDAKTLWTNSRREWQKLEFKYRFTGAST